MTTIEALPKNGNVNEWTDQEKALVEAAGLVSRGNLAPRPTVEAFLQHCRRTGLDPIARQIYAIERGGKWGIQISIDGARLVAERSREYRGQTAAQWTADGEKWVDVWLAKTPPAAARVGVHREGFVEPLVIVATWDQYAQPNGAMWKKMPALMLAKCAEALALRKAFPQDLSGLYTSEEMDQATVPKGPQAAPRSDPRPAAPRGVEPNSGEPTAAELSEAVDADVVDAEVIEEPVFDAAAWGDKIQQCLTAATPEVGVDMLRMLHGEAKEAGLLRTAVAEGMTLDQLLRTAKSEIEAGK